VGYDDTIARYPFLDFTTVRQDPTELAQTAIADLIARIRGEKYLSETFLTSSKLIVRGSTAQPRKI
jgi:DNA-binding LacI/PurR family transcriptional regulator